MDAMTRFSFGSHTVVKAVLMLSLSANVFLGGFMLRMAMHGFGPPRPEHLIQRIASILPREDAAIFRATVDAHRAEMDFTDKARHAFEARMTDALTRDPFEPQAMADAFETFHATQDATHRTIEIIAIEAASRMSAEGRAALADFRP